MKFLEVNSVWTETVQKISSKIKVLDFFSKQFSSLINIDAELILEAFIARESLQSTAFEKGIAIPHCVLNNVGNVYVGFLKLNQPICFEDEKNIHCDLFFCIIADKNSGAEYLRVLAKISRFLRDDANKDLLRKTKTIKQIYDILDVLDNEKILF
jgi:PTS system nitrogen regulatory IIA component